MAWDSVASIWLFLIGLGLSYIGSMPPGLINLTVTQLALKRNLPAASWAALGAAWVEGVQAWVAISFSSLFKTHPEWQMGFRLAAMLIFLALAAYLIFSPTEAPKGKEWPRSKSFLVGVGVSTLNLLAFPYWFFYGTLLRMEKLLPEGKSHILILSIGVAAGTFLLLLSYIRLGQYVTNRLPHLAKWTNRVTAAIFLLLGFWQAYLLLTT